MGRQLSFSSSVKLVKGSLKAFKRLLKDTFKGIFVKGRPLKRPTLLLRPTNEKLPYV